MKFSNVASHQWSYCKEEFDPSFALLTAMKKTGAGRRNSCKRALEADQLFQAFWCLHICWEWLWYSAPAGVRMLWPIPLSLKRMALGSSIAFICSWLTKTQPAQLIFIIIINVRLILCYKTAADQLFQWKIAAFSNKASKFSQQPLVWNLRHLHF